MQVFVQLTRPLLRANPRETPCTVATKCFFTSMFNLIILYKRENENIVISLAGKI